MAALEQQPGIENALVEAAEKGGKHEWLEAAETYQRVIDKHDPSTTLRQILLGASVSYESSASPQVSICSTLCFASRLVKINPGGTDSAKF